MLSWGEYLDYDLEGSESEPIVEGGYSNLVNFLVKSLEGKVKIKLNQIVTKIKWDGSLAIVTTEDGNIYQADYVIIALPLGVLKDQHSDIFDPALPQYKAEIIASLGFGLMDKIFLEFEEPFWDVDNPGIQLVMTDVAEDDTEDLRETWQNYIAGFDGVCGRPRVLCGWPCGEPARVMETISEDQVGRTSYCQTPTRLGTQPEQTWTSRVRS